MPGSPQPPKRSWRDDAGRGGPTKREWQKDASGGSGGGPRFSRRLKIILAISALFAVIGGVVIWWLMLRHTDPPRYVLIQAGYETNLTVPHNVYGKRVVADLKAWSEEQNKNYRGDEEHSISTREEELTSEGDPFDKALRGSNAKKVVVYVAVHGSASPDRGAYLIPHNASPLDGIGGYSMDKALAALGTLPKDTQKLLILDVTQIDADWSLGMLHNDFVRSLANNDKIKSIPNLVILVSADEEQRSWVSEEYGRTIFGHFVMQGLNGAADKQGLSQITAQDLIDYVKDQVKSWVRHNRGTLQTPRVFDPDGVAKNIVLTTKHSLSAYNEPDPEKITKWKPSETLIDAWRERDKLAHSYPHPATYTPNLWRQYHDALLRYEQLSRANDPNADTMEQEVRKLTERIRSNQQIEQKALAATLTMPAALGWSLSDKDDEKLKSEIDALWKSGAKEEEFARSLKAWQDKASSSWTGHLVRVRFVALLLQRARTSDKDFDRVCTILPKLDDEIAPRRPAEAHFALMMKRDYIPDEIRDGARIRKALATRILAEEAALGLPRSDAKLPDSFTPYSEQLLPWINKDVVSADKVRRKHEDLLFASPKEATRLGGTLGNPEDLYQKVQDRAKNVQTALSLRDQMLADMPYYSRWAALRGAYDPKLALAEDEEKRWLESWAAVHQLCQLLEQQKPDSVEKLNEQAKKARFKDFETEFRKAAEVRDNKARQDNWHRLNALLTVPLMQADDRANLLNDMADVEHDLNVGTKNASQTSGIDKDQNSANAKAAAKRQGRFAMSVLGVEHPVSKEVEPMVSKPEGDWQRSLNRAGVMLGDAFSKQTNEAYEDTRKARKSPMEEARPLLAKAALNVRLGNGAAAAAWSTVDPVGENRNILLYDLMRWQGQRTFADYWAADDRRSTNPYYRAAGMLFVTASRSMAGNDSTDLTPEQKKARLKEIDDPDPKVGLAARLNAPDKMELVYRNIDTYQPGPADLQITDRAMVPRVYGIDRAETTPEGYPVVWEELGTDLRPAKATDLERRALDAMPPKPGEMPIEFDLIPEQKRLTDFTKRQTTSTVRGLFRGRAFYVDTKVTLNGLPEITAMTPQMPQRGRISVVASKKDYDSFAAKNSELVIVVDYSGSMNYLKDGKTLGKPGDPNRRINRVLDALKTVMEQVPDGVKVTLLTFRQGENDRASTILVRWPTRPWNSDPTVVKNKFADLYELTPRGGTPLARATVEARQCFSKDPMTKKEFEGAKTIVILTDGGDNSYKADAEALGTKGKSMAACLKQYFQNSDIAINVVGVETNKLTDEDEKKGLAEYKEAIDAIDGKFFPVENTDKLVEELKRQIIQIRFHVDEKGGELILPPNTRKPREGYEVSPDKTNPRPVAVTPGEFNVFLQTYRLKRDFLAQPVYVGPGESLTLRLAETPDGRGFYFRRDVYVDSPTIKDLNLARERTEVERHDQKNKSWVLAVLQNQASTSKRDGLEMMVSLEERDLTNVALLGMTRPRFVWFRTSVASNPKELVPGLRFYPLADYPAPCYRLEYVNWPKDKETKEPSPPLLDVWWNDHPLPEGKFVVRPADRPFTRLTEFPVKIRPGDQPEPTTVVIESITYERRPYAVQPNEPETKDVECLVVRLRYPVGSQPFFVQLPEKENVGAEHKFYTSAGMYTGIFWNVSERNADELKSLTVYSVEGVLKEANHVGPLKLKKPDDKAPPPKPHD
jgi:hypothetical protein